MKNVRSVSDTDERNLNLRVNWNQSFAEGVELSSNEPVASSKASYRFYKFSNSTSDSAYSITPYAMMPLAVSTRTMRIARHNFVKQLALCTSITSYSTSKFYEGCYALSVFYASERLFSMSGVSYLTFFSSPSVLIRLFIVLVVARVSWSIKNLPGVSQQVVEFLSFYGVSSAIYTKAVAAAFDAAYNCPGCLDRNLTPYFIASSSSSAASCVFSSSSSSLVFYSNSSIKSTFVYSCFMEVVEAFGVTSSSKEQFIMMATDEFFRSIWCSLG